MKVLDRNGNELAVGDRVLVEGPGFTNRHLGTVEQMAYPNAGVRIDGLLGNPYWFTASFDDVIEVLDRIDPTQQAAEAARRSST